MEDAQHERFAQVMAEGKMNQGQAYLEAGYQCSSLEIASASATRLLKNVNVQARISYLQEEAAKLAVLDRSYVLLGLMANAAKGYETNDLSASNRAFELLGKHLGVFQEAPQSVINVAVVPQETRATLVAQLLGLRELEASGA
jgi:phage terminase small subunit